MPVSPAALDAVWIEPVGPFWTPKVASRFAPCISLQNCSHKRCAWLHRAARSKCRLCRDPIGWGQHAKPDPQAQLFGPKAFVHIECDAARVGGELRAAAARGAHFRRILK